MSDKKVLKAKLKQRRGKRMNVSVKLKKINPKLESNVAVNKEAINLSLHKLTTYRTELQDLDNAIVDLITDDLELDEKITKAAELSDEILSVICKCKQRLQQHDEANHCPGASAKINENPDQAFTSRAHASVKLPKLDVATFSGDPLKWQEFWDNFESTIHLNDNLSPIDKFKYLRSFLTGDALRLVDGYRLTSANYEAVLKALEERYGRKQMIIFAHFEAMLAVSVATHDIKQLRMVSDECEKHIKSLVALGLPEETFAQVFTPIMLSKLPKYVKMELHRKNGTQLWSLSNLREFLKDEILARDMSQRTFGGANEEEKAEGIQRHDTPKHKTNQKKPIKTQGRQHATSSLLSNATSGQSKCAYCDESHFSDQCKKYPDVASRQAQAKGKCYCCLRSNRSARECKRTVPCAYSKKPGHHRSLCYAKFGTPKSNKPKDTALTAESLNVEAQPFVPATSALLSHGKRTILETAIATITDENGCKKGRGRIIFDTGCSRSYITAKMHQSFGLETKGHDVVLQASIESTKRRTVKYKSVEIRILGLNGQPQFVTANVIPTITCSVPTIPIDPIKYPVVNQITLAEPLSTKPELVEVDILIGNDYYHEFVGTERIKCPNGPYFLSSTLGFIATGRIPTDQEGTEEISSLLLTSAVQSPRSNFYLERFWSLEDIGIKDERGLNDDDRAMEIFNKSVSCKDGRYYVGWPWKDEKVDLEDNFSLAYGRLEALLRRLRRNPQTLQAYRNTILEQERLGIIERAPVVPTGKNVYYMPRHCVVTPTKTTTKLRVVYDASSKGHNGTSSLNECLYRGPVMLEDLCGLLMRFRLMPIAMVSDIEKAFLQVGLQESERDCTRFLWVEGTGTAKQEYQLVTYRFCRVPFGVVSSPFLLAATVAHHLKQDNSDVAKDIMGICT